MVQVFDRSGSGNQVDASTSVPVKEYRSMSAASGRQARPRRPFRHRAAALVAATSLGGLTAALLVGGTAAQAAAVTTAKIPVTGYTVVSGDTLSGDRKSVV